MNHSSHQHISLRVVGEVRSLLTDPGDAPRQGDEDAPAADIVLEEWALEAAAGLRVGDGVVVVTWLHLADREVLATHPRDDPTRPRLGVFATRSQDRPNPVGLHPCTVVGVSAAGIRVDAIEAVDGTPVVDIKCALLPAAER